MITVILKGFLCRIYSGLVPLPALKGISSFLSSSCIASGHKAEIRRYAVAAVSDLWYRRTNEMKRIMESVGLSWGCFRSFNQLGSYIGIGSGKDTIGVFEMHVVTQHSGTVIFVPPPIHPELKHMMGDLEDISITTLPTPRSPEVPEGWLAVSSGTWGKGEMSFLIQEDAAFDHTALEFICLDLCDLGIAEEHLLNSISYKGTPVTCTCRLESGEEFYPVVCLPPGSTRWTDLGNYIISSVSPT